MTVWAEVIGDPIGHSLSPHIHAFWLEALGLAGEYRRHRVVEEDLPGFLKQRRTVDQWLGCNVTAPLKEAILPLLDAVDEAASEVGAVNCVTRAGGRLVGLNTDLDGISEALAGADVRGARVAVIGAGGAAKAALLHCARAGADEITILVRTPDRAAALGSIVDGRCRIIVEPLRGSRGFEDVRLIVNASPAGMAHADPLPPALLTSLSNCAPGTTVFDMVYVPIETPLLKAAAAAGLRSVDGLTMLIGQARRAFRSFFGVAPPSGLDRALRATLLDRDV